MKKLLICHLVFILNPAILWAGTPDGEVIAQLEKVWKGFQNPRPNMSVRELFSFSLNAAAIKWHPEYIETAYEMARQMQDRDPASKTYGNFKWYWKDKGPDDLNAVEFCMHHAILTWSIYKQNLTEAGREKLQELIKFGIEGVKRRGVKVGYTNIFLMHIWNEIAIGENTGSPEFAQQGYDDLNEWIAFTSKSGIREYVSTTYYGVDLDILGLIARHAKNADAKRKAEMALRLYWSDIAAVFYAPCGRLGGPHSRDYDYLTGHGALDDHLKEYGWLNNDLKDNDVFRELCKWTPPPEIRAQFENTVPRTIIQRFGEKPWEYAVTYMANHFCIGSAEESVGPEDKVFTLNFSGGPKEVMGNFVMDGRGDPYGINKAVTGGGHMKSHHLIPFFSSVQRGPEVLFVASDNTTKRKDGAEFEVAKMYAHLVLPDGLKVWNEDKAIAIPEGEKAESLPLNKPVFLRDGKVAVGIRVLLANARHGGNAPLQLVNDGEKHGAMRLTCVLSETKEEGRGTVVFWIRAAEGLDEEAFAEFRTQFAHAEGKATLQGAQIEVSASGVKGQMKLAADLDKGHRTVHEGGEPGAEEFLLGVNGIEVARPLLESAKK